MLISIIINCRNGSSFLSEALQSIIDQQYRDYEVVFFDNNSEDDSVEIFLSFDFKIKKLVESKVSLNLGEARSRAIEYATGDLITFLDVDDTLLPNALQIYFDSFCDAEVDVAYGGVLYCNLQGNEIGRYMPPPNKGNFFKYLLNKFDVNVPSLCFRSNIFKRSGLSFDATIVSSEEFCLLIQLAAKGYIFKSLSLPLSKYRIHSGSITSTRLDVASFERKYALDKVAGYLCNYDKSVRSAFTFCYKKSHYYDAKFFFQINEKKMAMLEMNKIKYLNLSFFCLFILSHNLLLWNFIHHLKGRKLYNNLIICK
jgi:glycosyltransferase involved in cell wall biosynthesis